MDPVASFGHWLQTRRRALRLPRAELAALAGCAAITLRKIEADERRPSLQLADLLAARLGLTPAERATFVRVARGELPADRLPAPELLAAPPASPGPASPSARTNLPAALTSFVGRERELAELGVALAQQRLLTLTGVGGVGKTRLAIELGMGVLRDSPPGLVRDGVWLAELAALADPALLPPTLARVFGLPEQPGRPAHEQLQSYLAERQLLLILDNCEHLIEACAALTERLLQRCWQLRILATSREPLRIAGEQVIALAPLALPPAGERQPSQILAATAAQLFVARLEPGSAPPLEAAEAQAIGQICRRLDGIPLAIELAAPLARSMPLAEIAAQLDRQIELLSNAYRTAIPRHQTMHSALVWSYRLLAPEQQQVLACCAVFAGGWAPAAAQVVCADFVAAERVQPALEQLVAKSLALREGVGEWRRYRLLEPVRQFAQAQLAASGQEQAVRQRHAEFFLGRLDTCEAQLKGTYQLEALAAMDRDSENIRTAWWWAANNDMTNLLGLAVTSLRLFYEWQGRSREGYAAMQFAAEKLAKRDLSAGIQAMVLATWARFTYLVGDRPSALTLLQQAETILAASNQAEAATIQIRAGVLLQRGLCTTDQNFVVARDAFTQSYSLFQLVGDQSGSGAALAGLGYVASNLHSNYALAQHYLKQSVACYRLLGDRVGLCEVLTALSLNSRLLNNVARSEMLAHEASTLAQELGNPRLIAQTSSNLGAALFWSNKYPQSYDVLCAALAVTQALDHRSELPNIYYRLGNATLYLGRYAEARATYTIGLAAAQAVDALGNINELMVGLLMVTMVEDSASDAQLQAEQAIERSTRLGEEHTQRMALVLCGFCERRLGNLASAWQHSLIALRSGLAVQTPVHWTLWLITLLLADCGDLERAALAFATAKQIRHEDNPWTQDLALREIDSIIAALPAATVAAAQARLAKSDIWQIGMDLLVELEAEKRDTSRR